MIILSAKVILVERAEGLASASAAWLGGCVYSIAFGDFIGGLILHYFLLIFCVVFLAFLSLQHTGYPRRRDDPGNFESNCVIRIPVFAASLLFFNFKKRKTPVWLMLLQLANLGILCFFMQRRFIAGITSNEYYIDKTNTCYAVIFGVFAVCFLVDSLVYLFRKKKHETDYYNPNWKNKR